MTACGRAHPCICLKRVLASAPGPALQCLKREPPFPAHCALFHARWRTLILALEVERALMIGTTIPLPLFDEQVETITFNACNTHARAEQKFLWLACYFPKIALESIAEYDRESVAVAIVQLKGCDIVHTCSPMAEKAGIKKGMKLGSAYALCSALSVYPIDKTTQQKKLKALATAMQQFTSRVSLCSTNALLLEIGGSVTYFGSVEKIQAKVAECLFSAGPYYVYFAASPVPSASLLLARSGSSATIRKLESLRSALGGIPIDYLPFPEKQKRRLENSGVRLMRDLWRLPTDQLTKRFGSQFVEYTQMLLGRKADMRETFQRDIVFTSKEEFLYEVFDLDLIAASAYQLLDELCAFLRDRDLAINQFSLRFFHEKQPTVTLVIASGSTTQYLKRLFKLLETRLENYQLSAPVIGVQVQVGEFFPYQAISKNLPTIKARDQQVDDSIDSLFDQVKTRIGCESLTGLSIKLSHCPEQACEYSEVSANVYLLSKNFRPLWLLDEVIELPTNTGIPTYRNRPVQLGEPERIETAWWQEAPIQRDYFIATESSGSKVWLYRDLNSQRRWYLHGLFA